MTREEEAIQILEKLREKYDDPLKCEYWWAVKEGIKALLFKEEVIKALGIRNITEST